MTKLHKEVILGLYNASGKFPIIYTRQNIWDVYIKPDPLWFKCPLFPARYKNGLTGPWSDGYCKFRDWNEWKFWQYTASADGAYWGMADNEADLDYFNGTKVDLYKFAGKDYQEEPTLESKVATLWREAETHGWNLAP